MLASLKEMAVIWWEYRRTLYALEQLGPRSLADLAIDQERLRDVAWTAARNSSRFSMNDLNADQYESTAALPASCEMTASTAVAAHCCGQHQTPVFGPSGSTHQSRPLKRRGPSMDTAQRRDARANSG